MMWGYGLNWLSMTLMMLAAIVAIVLLVVLVWAVMRRQQNLTTSPTQPIRDPTASKILSQRYARGEIDATTFEQMRKRLEASDHAPQRSRGEGRNSVGESLFDGITPGSDIL